LVQLIEDKYSDLKDWPSIIQSSPAASKVSMPTIEADINNLKKGLQTIENAIAKVQKYDSGNDKFKDIMTEFLAKGKTDFSELEETLVYTQTNYASLLELYGEDPKVTPEEFFKIWAIFITMYQKAKEENEKAIENEKKRAKREKGKSDKSGVANKDAGLVDGLLSNLTVRGKKVTPELQLEEGASPDIHQENSPRTAATPHSDDKPHSAAKPTPKLGMGAGVAEEALSAFNSLQKSKGGAKKPAVKAPTLDLADEALSAFTQMKKPASKKSAGTIVIPTAEPTTTEPPKETS